MGDTSSSHDVVDTVTVVDVQMPCRPGVVQGKKATNAAKLGASTVNLRSRTLWK